nr:unnamed protein product [Spirometra erinaceieuropaei]
MHRFTTRVIACNPSEEKSSNEIKPFSELPDNAGQRSHNVINQRMFIAIGNKYRVPIKDGFSCDLKEVTANAIVITRYISDSSAIVEVESLEFPNIGRHFAKNLTCEIPLPNSIWLAEATSEIGHAVSQAFANIPLLQCKIEVVKEVSGEDWTSIKC